MSRQYYDLIDCPNCERETLHFIYDAEHERDSSHDYHECQFCLSYRYGMSEGYSSPLETEFKVIHVDLNTINFTAHNYDRYWYSRPDDPHWAIDDYVTLWRKVWGWLPWPRRHRVVIKTEYADGSAAYFLEGKK
jgi:hypothetical protein